MHDFWQSSEAAGLSQVRKMLRQLTGQFSAHYSSVRNVTYIIQLQVGTELCLWY